VQRPTLPVPDATGVYTFPDDLVHAHHAHQHELARRLDAGDSAILHVTAPYGGRRYLIEERRPSGRPVIAIEPHHDDLALSASGMLLSRPRPLTVITVFTRTVSTHSSVLARHSGEATISALRARESRQALRPLRAQQRLLGYADARPPYRSYDMDVLERVTADLEHVIGEFHARPESRDAELLAPAAVTRHPDHLLIHEAARRVGCRWFWDDLAFWQTYALSADDRHLFDIRVGDELTPELTDITGALLDKLTLLYLHGSQLQPTHAMYRPLRYAWTTAAELRPVAGPGRFAERSYRRNP